MKKLTIFIAFVSHFLCSQNSISGEVKSNNGPIELPGTLSVPHMENTVPLALFIHGSSNIDRNGNQGELAKANCIKIFVDSLNAQGIASYRYTKPDAKLVIIEKMIHVLKTVENYAEFITSNE